MMLKRVMGKACFATLQDMSGRVQLYVTLDGVGAEALDAFKRWDLGDILGAEGTLFKTKTGELSVKCTRVRLLSKSLRPLPEKFHGHDGHRAALPPALRRPHHEPGRRARCSSSARRSCRPSASSSSRAATSRSRRR